MEPQYIIIHDSDSEYDTEEEEVNGGGPEHEMEDVGAGMVDPVDDIVDAAAGDVMDDEMEEIPNLWEYVNRTCHVFYKVGIADVCCDASNNVFQTDERVDDWEVCADRDKIVIADQVRRRMNTGDFSVIPGNYVERFRSQVDTPPVPIPHSGGYSLFLYPFLVDDTYGWIHAEYDHPYKPRIDLRRQLRRISKEATNPFLRLPNLIWEKVSDYLWSYCSWCVRPGFFCFPYEFGEMYFDDYLHPMLDVFKNTALWHTTAWVCSFHHYHPRKGTHPKGLDPRWVPLQRLINSNYFNNIREETCKNLLSMSGNIPSKKFWL